MLVPSISVIIPTYNRASILKKTVVALCEQQLGDLPQWELIVVNDGSTDNTRELLTDLRSDYPNRLIVIEQANQKQGLARNHGMSQAKGDLFVFLGDDIIPGQEFLINHWSRFKEDDFPETYAAIGRTYWHPEIRKTPFREWINDWGLQFGFSLIDNPDDLPFNFFYASNLAFSRHLYDRLGGFDHSFKEYGWEDTELGYRYKNRGSMRLRYIEEAATYHHHQLSITSFCQRQYKVGYSAVFFYRMYPELREFLHFKEVSASFLLIKPLLNPIARIFQYLDESRAVNLNRYTERVLSAYYYLGMYKAQREFR